MSRVQVVRIKFDLWVIPPDETDYRRPRICEDTGARPFMPKNYPASSRLSIIKYEASRSSLEDRIEEVISKDARFQLPFYAQNANTIQTRKRSPGQYCSGGIKAGLDEKGTETVWATHVGVRVCLRIYFVNMVQISADIFKSDFVRAQSHPSIKQDVLKHLNNGNQTTCLDLCQAEHEAECECDSGDHEGGYCAAVELCIDRNKFA
ncbi:uncharacterized protein MELLADRAFT_111601 [Melampsora larici-populina 98AG31]|uniref:Uncharacterized protein n=1 Tax=Melampsora larici-populina (strain 98AG31 / pathotype 3-4-7) TaxID=747676 RepID=F4S3Q7_MELLP|nr:uncharacterized protein MELLADRAFT_111601 [Melampsora larici-populina 98AG31]EGG00715.1 hypothetical protein MELLADRAFT_111601 [Melampsora larici-populina 98AG31]